MEHPIRRAAKKVGGFEALGKVLGGLSKGAVHQYTDQGRQVPAEHCALIERHTGVMRWELRPHDWFRIWPELIDRKGAPDVPHQEEVA